jgi:hypothetical protein
VGAPRLGSGTRNRPVDTCPPGRLLGAVRPKVLIGPQGGALSALAGRGRAAVRKGEGRRRTLPRDVGWLGRPRPRPRCCVASGSARGRRLRHGRRGKSRPSRGRARGGWVDRRTPVLALAARAGNTSGRGGGAATGPARRDGPPGRTARPHHAAQVDAALILGPDPRWGPTRATSSGASSRRASPAGAGSAAPARGRAPPDPGPAGVAGSRRRRAATKRQARSHTVRAGGLAGASAALPPLDRPSRPPQLAWHSGPGSANPPSGDRHH